jgi:hypothetical protein
LSVEYKVTVTFDLPVGIKLLPNAGDGFDKGKPGSWFIKWGIMRYYDDDGNFHQVKGRLCGGGQVIGEEVCDVDFKYPEEDNREAYGVSKKTE